MNALVRFNNPALTLTDWFDDLLDTSFFSGSNRNISNTIWPKVDIIESDNEYKVHADLPGLEKKDINITIENGVLSISGEKKEEKKDKKDGRYSYYERSYGRFCRSFNLPDHVDADHVDASYKDGVLELTIKKTEKAKPKAIEVKVN